MYYGGVIRNEGKFMNAVKAVKHPKYMESSTFNDSGLIFLSEKFDGPYATLEGTSYPEGGSKLTVAGHGGKSMNIIYVVQ